MNNVGCATPDAVSNDVEWTIDADLSVQSVIERPDCPPLIYEALMRLFSWQVRVETSVRRALGSPRLAPSFVAALLALGSEVTIGEGSDATRAELRALIEGDAKGRVSAVHVPACRGERRCGHAVVARTPADEPIVAAYAAIEMEGPSVRQARIALTGVWPEPARLAQAPQMLVGGPAGPDGVESVASAVALEVAPRGDYLGSVEYRRAMAAVLARRALEECLLQKCLLQECRLGECLSEESMPEEGSDG